MAARLPPTSMRMQTFSSLGLALVGIYLALFTWAARFGTYDVWSGFILLPAVVALSVPVARRIHRTEDDSAIARLLIVALALKIIGSVVRYLMVFVLYDGAGDAQAYAVKGAQIARQIWQGDFGLEVENAFPGTGFIEILTGFVFAIIGPTTIGGFILFGCLGFWGLYLFYRAFCLGVPDGDRRRFAALTFLMPSLLFWPSSIGKEAWMILTLGAASYGVARVLERHRGGYPLAVLGLFGAALVRPHVSALMCAALALVYLRRRKATRALLPQSFSLAIGTAVIIALLLLVVSQAQTFLGVEDANIDATIETLDTTSRNTAQGGSEFEAQQVRSPADIPAAAFTIIFRPLPMEAHNLQSLAASIEGVGLMALLAYSLARFRDLPRQIWAQPYLLFAATYSILFIAAFSSFNNFGILTRQRVQLFPLLFALLSIGLTARPRR